MEQLTMISARVWKRVDEDHFVIFQVTIIGCTCIWNFQTNTLINKSYTWKQIYKITQQLDIITCFYEIIHMFLINYVLHMSSKAHRKSTEGNYWDTKYRVWKLLQDTLWAHAHTARTAINNKNLLTRSIKLHKIAPLPFLFSIFICALFDIPTRNNIVHRYAFIILIARSFWFLLFPTTRVFLHYILEFFMS